MRCVATYPGASVITGSYSASDSVFHWMVEQIAPASYSSNYRYKLLALNENGIDRNAYFSSTATIINNTLDGNIYTDFYREITKNGIIQLLSPSYIFIIHTHGRKEGFYISDSTYLSMSDVEDCDLSGLKFALLLTCNTAESFSTTHITNNAPVNIVEQMICSGAETVVGFSQITYVSDCNRFAVDFAEATITNGSTISSAILNIDYSDYYLNMWLISRIGGNDDLVLTN
jgi:hypothetical protein